MLWLNEEAGWTLFQFSAVDLSVWAGWFVPPHLRQRKGRQHSPSRLTRKAETQRANRAMSETHQSLRSPLEPTLTRAVVEEAKRAL